MADLPMQLQGALETLVSGYAKEKLEKDARAISEAYRLRTGEGKRLLTAEGEAAAYAAARMPATYAAAHFALSEAIEASGLHPAYSPSFAGLLAYLPLISLWHSQSVSPVSALIFIRRT